MDISDPFNRQLRSRAAREGSSAKESIRRGVKRVLGDKRRRTPRRIKLPVIQSTQPATLDLDNDQIFEIISFP